MTKSFFGFRHRFLCGFETDLRVRAVAKRFLGGRAATAKCHPFFDWVLVAVRVDQFHFARNDVRTMLDCFDFYHNASNLTFSMRAASRSIEMPSARPGNISLGKACSLTSGERTLLACWSLHSAATNFSWTRNSWAMNEDRQKSAIAECDRQHARGVRSPERCLRQSELNGSLAAYEKFSRSTPFARHLGARANAIAKASIQVRGHDETEARRRASAIARRQMGCFRLRRRRSVSEHEDFAFVDRAGERRGNAGIKSNAKYRGGAGGFTRR